MSNRNVTASHGHDLNMRNARERTGRGFGAQPNTNCWTSLLLLALASVITASVTDIASSTEPGADTSDRT